MPTLSTTNYISREVFNLNACFLPGAQFVIRKKTYKFLGYLIHNFDIDRQDQVFVFYSLSSCQYKVFTYNDLPDSFVVLDC